MTRRAIVVIVAVALLAGAAGWGGANLVAPRFSAAAAGDPPATPPGTTGMRQGPPGWAQGMFEQFRGRRGNPGMGMQGPRGTIPWIGISIAPATLDQAQVDKFGLSGNQALRVTSVVADGPGAKAGLQQGDLIVAVGGTSVGNAGQLLRDLRGHQAGDTVALTIIRGDSKSDVNVTLQARPQTPPAQRALPPELQGLQGIPAGEKFQHFQGATLNLTDKDGNALVVTLTGGTVTNVTADSVTIDRNQGGSATYKVDANTIIRMKGGSIVDAVKNGAKVLIVNVGSSDHATAIMGGHLPLVPGL